MFQPRVKLEFVRRHCDPRKGWIVYVDIDPSEEGRTGSTRNSDESQERQKKMKRDAPLVKQEFADIGVRVGKRKDWFRSHGFSNFEGDQDVIAYHPDKKRWIVAEVEGASSGQPEQKLYRAIGQMVLTASRLPPNWRGHLVVVVYGDRIADHLGQASVLAKLGVSGVVIKDDMDHKLLFGPPLDAD